MIENLSLSRMAVLLVVALVVFGPERLPEIAAQLGRWIRQLRTTFDSMSSELKTSMGPELADMDLRSLHPKRYLADLLEDTEPQRPQPAASPASADPQAGLAAETPEPAVGTSAPGAPDAAMMVENRDAMELLSSSDDWGGELPQEWLDALRDDERSASS